MQAGASADMLVAACFYYLPELLLTSDDLSQYYYHCCEPADSKMAETHVMVGGSAVPNDKCVCLPASSR